MTILISCTRWNPKLSSDMQRKTTRTHQTHTPNTNHRVQSLDTTTENLREGGHIRDLLYVQSTLAQHLGRAYRGSIISDLIEEEDTGEHAHSCTRERTPIQTQRKQCTPPTPAHTTPTDQQRSNAWQHDAQHYTTGTQQNKKQNKTTTSKQTNKHTHTHTHTHTHHTHTHTYTHIDSNQMFSQPPVLRISKPFFANAVQNSTTPVLSYTDTMQRFAAMANEETTNVDLFDRHRNQYGENCWLLVGVRERSRQVSIVSN
jgi:hypothetical protein